MKLEIRSIGSSDFELEDFAPKTSDEVLFVLDVEVGVVGEDGADLFYVTVATKEALKSRPATPTTSKGPLILEEYSFDHLRQKVASIVAACERSTWLESVKCLMGTFDHEYDSYVLE